MRNLLFVLAGMVTTSAAAVSAEPVVRMHTSYYYIDGASATVLAAQLDQNGPVGADGKRYAGRTRWDIQWKFRHQQQGTACLIKDVAVAVGIAQTLPKWRGEHNGAPTLKARWTKFLDALQRHENGHKEYALKIGKEVEEAVLAVKPASNCEDLEASANAVAQAIESKYQALDVEYERQSDHGRNQGATLL